MLAMSISQDPELALFAHLVARGERDLDLAQAALLIAASEYPGLDPSRYLGRLDVLAESAQRTLGREASLVALARWLFEKQGFRGNSGDYYDPRNSFLNEVLDRRTGIPITLGLVILEIARRISLPAHGVSFPGHFLLRGDSSGIPTFVDPFDGSPLNRADLRVLFTRATGEDRDPEPRLLETATKRQILVRLLNNLRGIYATRGDGPRLRRVLERMSALVRSEELRRQLEQLGGGAPWFSGDSTIN
jgi:regulator of sirC expression with transglutaminase-like and TPR domain